MLLWVQELGKTMKNGTRLNVQGGLEFRIPFRGLSRRRVVRSHHFALKSFRL